MVLFLTHTFSFFSLCVALLGTTALSAQTTYTAHSMDWQSNPAADHTRAVAVTDTGFQESYAGGIAITGQSVTIAGWVRPTAGQSGTDQGFFWPIDLANPRPVTAFKEGANTRARGINRDGLMVGKDKPQANSPSWEGFRRSVDLDEGTQPLNPIAGSSGGWGNGMNGAGYAVGASQSTSGTAQVRGTAWLPGSATARPLDWLDPALPDAEANAVNRGLHAVGWSEAFVSGSTPNGVVRKAVIWPSLTPQALTDLSAFTLLPTQGDEAWAISAGIAGVLEEQVVGEYWDASSGNPAKRAFVWDDQLGMQDLRSQVTGGLGATDVLVEARVINSLGEIAATAQETNGHRYAVLLTPNISSPRLGRVNAPLAGAQTVVCGIGFSPNTQVTLVYDLSLGWEPVPGCGGLFMEVNPLTHAYLSRVYSDVTGRVIFPFDFPGEDLSATIYLQAYSQACDLSNPVAEVVG